MKRKTEDLSKEEIIVILDTLYTALSSIQGRDAIKLFLRDLLTPSERIMLGRRIIIARLLMAGETYGRIQERMGVGRTTVGRVQHWLDDQFPGFEKAIAGIEKEYGRRAEKKLYATSALHRLKKQYPLYYLLLPSQKITTKPIYPARKSKTK